MKLGEQANTGAAAYGKPLTGIRVLALEQMMALPFATQLLARLGAEVVKVESPTRGDSARGAQPAIQVDGVAVGHTFLRYNLNKKSIAIDIRSPEGRDLVLELLPGFDVVCENLGPGRAASYGLGYEELAARDPRLIYLSLSGFGEVGESPFRSRLAYAAVVEAMCGMYDHVRAPNQPPLVNPSTGMGDTVTGMYAVIGVLAALEHRHRIGEGQYIDLSMYDAMLAMNDVMYNHWSLGLRKNEDEEFPNPVLLTTFRCSDGWLLVFVAREHQFARFAAAIEHPELVDDPRLADRRGWHEHTDSLIRPIVEKWSLGVTRREAAQMLADAGVPCAPCNTTEDLLDDRHVEAHHMIVELPREDGVEQPVLVAGNPLKLSKTTEGPDLGFPALGQHTEEILADMLGAHPDRIDALRAAGIIG